MPRKRKSEAVFIERALLESAAYHQLSGTATKVLLQFHLKRVMEPPPKNSRRNHWTIVNNGSITFSYSEAQSYGISRRAFGMALTQLIDHGFIDRVEIGGRHRQTCSRYGISDHWRQKNSDPPPTQRHPCRQVTRAQEKESTYGSSIEQAKK